MRRVVITGLGIVSCLGTDKESVSASLRASRSGIAFNPSYAEIGMRSGAVWEAFCENALEAGLPVAMVFQARHDVGQPTRRERHDVAHSAIGEGALGLRAPDQGGGRQGSEHMAACWAHRVSSGGFGRLSGSCRQA